MLTVSSLEPHTSEPLDLQEQKTHPQILKQVNPTARHTRAQALLPSSQKARLKKATVPPMRDLLAMPVPKAHPIVEMAHRHQTPKLLAIAVLKLNPLVVVAHRHQTGKLLAYRLPGLKVTTTVRAAHRLRAQEVKQ